RVVESLRAGAQAAEEGRPDALEEVERVEPRPQQPGELAADDQADLGLVAGEQLAGGRFVPGPDAGEERPELALPVLVRAWRWVARTHRRPLPGPGGPGSYRSFVALNSPSLGGPTRRGSRPDVASDSAPGGARSDGRQQRGPVRRGRHPA